MKQIVPLIILILYSILQARRKAMREQKMRENAMITQRTTVAPQSDEPDEQNKQEVERQSAPMIASDRWKNMTQEADQFIDDDKEEVPSEIQRVVAASRLARQATVTARASYDEVVDPRPVVVSVAPVDAYEQVTVARRRINFDKQSLRTFFVTREALGPPRSRKPFRPSIKARE